MEESNSGWMGLLLARLAATPQLVDTPDGGKALVQFKREPSLWYPKQQAQQHVFHDPDDLIAYLVAEGIEVPVVVGVDGAKGGGERIVAMIEPHAANHSTISCPLPYAPIFAAWAQKFRAAESVSWMGQAAMHELVRFFGEALRDPTRDVMLGQIGTLSVAEGQDLKVEIDARGLQRFRGGSATTAVDGSIPSVLLLEAQVFEYSDDLAAFEAKLSMQVREGKALFKLDCPALELVRRREVGAIVTKIRAALAETGIPVYAAALQTVTVPKLSTA